MAAAGSPQGVPHGAVQIEAAMRELLVTDTQRSQAARTQLTSALRSQFCAAALIFLVQHSSAIEVRRNAQAISAQRRILRSRAGTSNVCFVPPQAHHDLLEGFE